MNTTDIASQLRLAADILETGHPWERLSRNSEWVKSELSPLKAIASGDKIRPILARPPYDAELHNPDNLTAEQVGVGYRLALKGEPVNGKADIRMGDKWETLLTPTTVNAATFRLPLSVPWPEQPQPFTLPTPPPGMQWHREDGWTAKMLPHGTRPLVDGETVKRGDECRELRVWKKDDDGEFGEARPHQWHHRTTRPLLFTHSGHEWTWHRAGDPMPCEGARMVVGMTLRGGAQRIPTAAKNYLWEVNDFNPIIGWRYADAEKPDPYAKYKQALQEGKTVQVLNMKGEWMDWRGDEDFSPRHPENIRIKPDDSPPWIAWHGGECPLKDDEVEEWEYMLRDKSITKTSNSPSRLKVYWLNDDHVEDIISYRVLKWRKQEPKKKLEPEDVPPGSALRSPSWEYGGHVTPNVFLGVVCWANTSGNVHLSYEQLMKDGWQINRSIPVTGKWNPDAWEACEK